MSSFHKLVSSRVLLLLSLGAAVVGGKFLLVDRYGSNLPFWDQWDAEGDHLLVPYVDGRLTASQLFAAHNEHRIFFTRLLALGLYRADQQEWDAKLEMTANAVLHAIFAAFLGWLALQILPRLAAWGFALLIFLFFTSAAAWENILGGFQSQFYFLLLFSALHLDGTLRARPRSWRWWTAPLAGLAALFSMASGVMSAAAIVFILFLRFVRSRQLTRADWVAASVNLVLLVIGGFIHVAVAGHNGLQADSLHEWTTAIVHELSWPVGHGWFAVLMLIPSCALARQWWRRKRENPVEALLLGCCVWSGMQVAALAYARGGFEHGYSSRYTDLLGTGWLVSILALAVLHENARAPRFARFWLCTTGLFVALGIWGLSQQAADNSRDFLQRLPGINKARIAAVRDYVTTRNPLFFARKPWDELPYPEAHRLAGLLDVPALRSSLPGEITLSGRPEGSLSRFAGGLLKHGDWFLTAAAIFAGLGLVVLIPSRPLNGANPHSERLQSLVAVFPLVAALAIAAVLATRLGILPQPIDPFAPRADLKKVPSFALSDPLQPTYPPSAFVGGAFVTSHRNQDWLGTYVGTDTFTGRACSTVFTLTGSRLHIPIAGYPTSAGNSLTFVVLDGQGKTLASILYDGPDPREAGGAWDLTVMPWIGQKAQLVLLDVSTSTGGWLAVGVPSFDHGRSPVWLDGVPRNYLWFLCAAITLTAMIFLPGLALATYRPKAWTTEPALLAIPGMLLLAIGGLVVWRGGAGAMALPADLWLAGSAALGLTLGVRWWRSGSPLTKINVYEIAVYGCVAGGAFAFGVLPAEVAQEFDPHTTAQARMIASPPDHAIPYRTAVYFYHGKDGREDRKDYFGNEWSAGSRGPLVPLEITAGLVLLGQKPEGPPTYALDRWPASKDGFYIARIIGILTNALVVLGAVALARRLNRDCAAVALTWLAVAPITLINVDFLWPKLSAIFFLLLGVREIVGERRIGRTAVWTALAYLSHPVGGLMVPLIAGLICWGNPERLSGPRRPSWGTAAGFLVVLGLLLAPWLLYNHWIGLPSLFLRYPLGDGYGYGVAGNVQNWLNCRVKNLYFSLVPGSLFFSDEMRSWLEVPLSQPLRWAIGYAKGLPGELGLGIFAIAVTAVVRRPISQALSSYRTWLLFGAGILMLLFWGYSADGLGRNCLEPVAILLMVYTARAMHPSWEGWKWLFLLTAAEALAVRVIGVVFAPGFSANYLGTEAWVLGVVCVIAGLLPACAYFVKRSPLSPR